MISEIVSPSPMCSRVEIASNLESAENRIADRSVGDVVGILASRYGTTDSERAWACVAAFTEFKRDPNGTFNDFRARFYRRITRLDAHGVAVNESVALRRPIQAMRIPGGQLHILLSTMGAFGNPSSVGNLRLRSNKMYETHRGETDSSAAYTLN